MGINLAQYFLTNSTFIDYGGQSGSCLVVASFTKPLFILMNEKNKSIQIVAATCVAKIIENAKDPPMVSFGHLCPLICK